MSEPTRTDRADRRPRRWSESESETTLVSRLLLWTSSRFISHEFATECDCQSPSELRIRSLLAHF
eukprot:4548325-Prymnesium_polylepis.1